MDWVLILGLLINAIALPIAARRVVWLYRLITSGQPDPGRVPGVTGRIEWCVRDSVETFREIDEIGFELAGCYARTPSWLNPMRVSRSTSPPMTSTWRKRRRPSGRR